MSKPLIIIGNGGHASVLTETLLLQNEQILGFTAPMNEENNFQLSYLGTDEVIKKYASTEIDLVLGIGSIGPFSLRERIYNQFIALNYRFKSVIHPSAIIVPSVCLGQGVQVMAGAILQTNTTIADNSIINTGAIIDHDCTIESHVHIAPGCKLSGGVHVQSGTHIGTGATIIQGIQIGSGCLIGAGSVVIKNVSDNLKVVGVPAKEVE